MRVEAIRAAKSGTSVEGVPELDRVSVGLAEDGLNVPGVVNDGVLNGDREGGDGLDSFVLEDNVDGLIGVSTADPGGGDGSRGGGTASVRGGSRVVSAWPGWWVGLGESEASEVVVKVGSKVGPAGNRSDRGSRNAVRGVLVLSHTVSNVSADLLRELGPVIDARAVRRVDQVASEVAHGHPRQPGSNTSPANGGGGDLVEVREDVRGGGAELEYFSGLVVGERRVWAVGSVEVEGVGVHKRNIEWQNDLASFDVDWVRGSRVVGLEDGVVIDVHDGDGLSVVGVSPGVHDLVGLWVNIVQELAGDEGVVAFGSLETATDVESNGLEELSGELFRGSWVSIDRSVESEKNFVAFVERASDSDETFEVNSGRCELGPGVSNRQEGTQEEQDWHELHFFGCFFLSLLSNFKLVKSLLIFFFF